MTIYGILDSRKRRRYDAIEIKTFKARMMMMMMMMIIIHQ
jgi:hypothetical protein